MQPTPEQPTQGRRLRCWEFRFTLYWYQRELCFHSRSNTGKHSRVSINTFINPADRPVRVSTLYSGGAASDHRVLQEWGSIQLKAQRWQSSESMFKIRWWLWTVSHLCCWNVTACVSSFIVINQIRCACGANQSTSHHNSVAVFVSITWTTFTFLSQCVMFAELYGHKMEQKLLEYVFSTEPWRDMGWFFLWTGSGKKTFATRFYQAQAWNVLFFVSRLPGHLLVLSK